MQLKYNDDTGENFVNNKKKRLLFCKRHLVKFGIHFTLCQHWLVYWSGANLARNHHANQWWHILRVRYHASFGLNELIPRISPQRQSLVVMGTLFMKIPSATIIMIIIGRRHWVGYPNIWRHYLDSKVHGANMGPSGADRTQVGPMLSPWTLLSGYVSTSCGICGIYFQVSTENLLKIRGLNHGVFLLKASFYKIIYGWSKEGRL